MIHTIYIYNETTQADNYKILAKIADYMPLYNLLSYHGRLQDTKIYNHKNRLGQIMRYCNGNYAGLQ